MASKLAFKLAALLGVLARLVLGGSFVVKNDTFILNDEALRLVTCECVGACLTLLVSKTFAVPVTHVPDRAASHQQLCRQPAHSVQFAKKKGNLVVLKHVHCRIHYFRIPHEYWRDRLQRMKALGCNSIQVREARLKTMHLLRNGDVHATL